VDTVSAFATLHEMMSAGSAPYLRARPSDVPIVQLCFSGVRLPNDPLTYFQAAAVSRKFVIPVVRKDLGD
jgi:hypothetical protein